MAVKGRGKSGDCGRTSYAIQGHKHSDPLLPYMTHGPKFPPAKIVPLARDQAFSRGIQGDISYSNHDVNIELRDVVCSLGKVSARQSFGSFTPSWCLSGFRGEKAKGLRFHMKSKEDVRKNVCMDERRGHGVMQESEPKKRSFRVVPHSRVLPSG